MSPSTGFDAIENASRDEIRALRSQRRRTARAHCGTIDALPPVLRRCAEQKGA